MPCEINIGHYWDADKQQIIGWNDRQPCDKPVAYQYHSTVLIKDLNKEVPFTLLLCEQHSYIFRQSCRGTLEDYHE